MTDGVSESLMSIKNSIIDTLKKENLKLQDEVKELEKKLSVLNEKSNNFNQYNNRQNNLEIQTIPANVPMKKWSKNKLTFLVAWVLQ